MTLLERIDEPAALRSLSQQELDELAREVRDLLVATVSENGGHLASNLGVVELTIALHRVFETPRDKLIWDVSHQSYVHKLLTGRRERFSTLRQYGGLSGFTSPQESPHDAFGTGHASTSISAALGMALARDLAGERHHVVAIIGDGALTGGMALEALDHASHLQTKVIVVLNDNGMAISPNIGAVSKFLNLLNRAPRYEHVKADTKNVLSRIPGGGPILRLITWFKGRLKGVLVPTAFWEKLGLDYIGPIDGHSVRDVEAALIRARDAKKKTTIVHVLTEKGKGYPPAEEDSARFHGLSPNGHGGNGNGHKPAPSYSDVFGQTVLQLMRQDERIVAVTAAMCEATGLGPAARAFPERVFDVGICEEHGVTMAAGLAMRGFRPIVAIYSTFLQRAYDQITHDVLHSEPARRLRHRPGGDCGRRRSHPPGRLRPVVSAASAQHDRGRLQGRGRAKAPALHGDPSRWADGGALPARRGRWPAHHRAASAPPHRRERAFAKWKRCDDCDGGARGLGSAPGGRRAFEERNRVRRRQRSLRQAAG